MTGAGDEKSGARLGEDLQASSERGTAVPCVVFGMSCGLGVETRGMCALVAWPHFGAGFGATPILGLPGGTRFVVTM